jgi:uncharacterized protein
VRAVVDTTRERLVTTDYVFDELLTLLKIRRSTELAIAAGRLLWSGEVTALEYLTRRDVNAAWELFQKYRDKAWSFTDCSSFVFMKRRKLTRALALDRHLDQFPGVERVQLKLADT